MLSYRFKNLNIRHQGQDYLANGIGFYVVEDYEEDGKEATFEKVEVYDLIDKNGFVTSPEVLKYFGEIIQVELNQNPALCRSLGLKSF
jgi:hypothetical protein